MQPWLVVKLPLLGILGALIVVGFVYYIVLPNTPLPFVAPGFSLLEGQLSSNATMALQDYSEELLLDDLPSLNDPGLVFDDDEENDTNFTVIDDPAPRTFHGEYNHMNVSRSRYFIYSPSGGMGNQLVELISACLICRRMNRTLLVPMLGAHSDNWYGYEKLPLSALFPMDRLFDFVHMSEFCQVQPLNVTVVEFTRPFMGNPEVMFHMFHPQRLYWRVDTLVDKVNALHRDTPLVYLHGAEMYHRWATVEKINEASRFIRFSSFLRSFSIRVAKHVFPPDGKFNAVHIRLGDYSDRWPQDPVAKMKAIARRASQLQNRSLPLYISTDEPRCVCMGRIRKENKESKTIDQMPRELMGAFRQLFAPEFRLDMQGVLDQLFCAQAQEFVPIVWSSFSQEILKIRKNRDALFPELI